MDTFAFSANANFKTQANNEITKSKVWHLLLSLRDIVSTATKYTFDKDELCYFNELVQKYVEKRLNFF